MLWQELRPVNQLLKDLNMPFLAIAHLVSPVSRFLLLKVHSVVTVVPRRNLLMRLE